MAKYIAAAGLLIVGSLLFINQDKLFSKSPAAGTPVSAVPGANLLPLDSLYPGSGNFTSITGSAKPKSGANPVSNSGATVTFHHYVDGVFTYTQNFPLTGYFDSAYFTYTAYNTSKYAKFVRFDYYKLNLNPCAFPKITSQGHVCQILVFAATNPTFNVHWKRTAYNLAVKVDGKGNIKGTDGIKEGSVMAYAAGTKVLLTASAATGYFFSSWGGDCSIFKGNPGCNVVMNSDKTVSAIFKPIKQLCAKTDIAKGSGVKKGKIKINDKEYEYNTGGWGNGPIPLGTYTVTNCRTRTKTAMSVDGFGFSCDLTDGTGPKTGKKRVDLRIHPDGGVCGTEGCIGITGNKDTQKDFYNEMTAELGESGGTCELVIGE